MNEKVEKSWFEGKNVELCGDPFGIYIVIDTVSLNKFTCRSLSLISRVINAKYTEMRVRDWKGKPKQIFGRFSVEKTIVLRNNVVKTSSDGE